MQSPTLTQIQIIQSLAEALGWMEKELSWGVALGELNHLTGRIGELYAAMITRGQMALATNQRGYDVVSGLNERISVKTVSSSRSVHFNRNTFHLVDRVIVLRINNDSEAGISVEELLDCTAADAQALMQVNGDKLVFKLSPTLRRVQPIENLSIVARAVFNGVEIRKYESGAIRIVEGDVVQQLVVKDFLRAIAPDIGVEISNAAGGDKNTQQLGAEIIRAIEAKTKI